MFSTATVASSTRIPTANAKPPNVMMLSVSPVKYMTHSDERIDSGIETATMMVLRQLPRNSKIINAVKHAAIKPSTNTLSMAAFTNTDWSNSSLNSMSGAAARTPTKAFLMPSTTSNVDDEPAFRMVSKAERRPSSRTILVCTPKPSRTLATSRNDIHVPLDCCLIGMSFSSSILVGLLLMPTM